MSGRFECRRLLEAAEGRLALRDGDEERFLIAARSAFRLADAMANEPILIMLITGNFVEKEALSLAAEVVANQSIPDCSRSLELTLSSADRLPELRRSFGCEAATMSTMFGGGRALVTPSSRTPRGTRCRSCMPAATRVSPTTLLEAVLFQWSLGDAPLQTLLVDDPPPPTSPFLMHRWMVHSLTPAARKTALAVRLNLAGAVNWSAPPSSVRTAAFRERAYPAALPAEAGVGPAQRAHGLPLRYTLDSSGSARIEIPGVTAAQLENCDAGLALEGLPLAGVD